MFLKAFLFIFYFFNILKMTKSVIKTCFLYVLWIFLECIKENILGRHFINYLLLLKYVSS